MKRIIKKIYGKYGLSSEINNLPENLIEKIEVVACNQAQGNSEFVLIIELGEEQISG